MLRIAAWTQVKNCRQRTSKSHDWKLMRYFLLRLTESVNSLCLTINWIVQFTFAFSLFAECHLIMGPMKIWHRHKCDFESSVQPQERHSKWKNFRKANINASITLWMSVCERSDEKICILFDGILWEIYHCLFHLHTIFVALIVRFVLRFSHFFPLVFQATQILEEAEKQQRKNKPTQCEEQHSKCLSKRVEFCFICWGSRTWIGWQREVLNQNSHKLMRVESCFDKMRKFQAKLIDNFWPHG